MTSTAINTGAILIDGLEIPATAVTLDGYRAWIASLGEAAPRASFCRGRVYVEMSPQSYESHAHLAEAIGDVLKGVAGTDQLGRYYRAPSWFTDEAADLSTEPDGFLIRFDAFRSGRVHIHPERSFELVGAPNMILEVVSKSSEKKDLKDNVTDFARADVEEYWIADGRGETPKLRILCLQGGALLDQAPDADGWLSSPFFARSFRLRRFVDPVGLIDFELRVR